MTNNKSLSQTIGKILSESTEATKRRPRYKIISGILAGTGAMIGLDYLGNGIIDHPLLDLAGGSGLYDGISAGFGKGIVGLLLSTFPEAHKLTYLLMTEHAQGLETFKESGATQSIMTKVMIYAGAYLAGIGLRHLNTYAATKPLTHTIKDITKYIRRP
jgi:hypothetical protein